MRAWVRWVLGGFIMLAASPAAADEVVWGAR